MQGCIESAGADWSVWDEDPELCQYIEACEPLHESDIEGLIEAITSQIRSRVYASRNVRVNYSIAPGAVPGAWRES